jgi:dTDP-4-amino-4,6-dideoxygalactose transaminase
MLKPISISLSPNVEKDDVRLAFKLIFQPWRWKAGAKGRQSKAEELEEEFKKRLGVKYAFSFNSGRSALMAILYSLAEIDGRKNEVLLQAFTCNAVPNPVLWSGFEPVFVDCDEKTFNIDVDDLRKKITPKTGLVIVQHTFGLPAQMDEIVRICQENNLVLVEDCAHSLGAAYQGRPVGTFGQAAFFSFSRDKVISSVYGGLAVTNNDQLAEGIRQFQAGIGYPSYWWVKQQLIHPVWLDEIILPTYSVLGKYIFVLSQWLHILSKAVHWKEKRGRRPGYFPKRMPEALAILALNQFRKLDRFNGHRREIAAFYRQQLSGTSFALPSEEEQIYLRFTVRHPKSLGGPGTAICSSATGMTRSSLPMTPIWPRCTTSRRAVL